MAVTGVVTPTWAAGQYPAKTIEEIKVETQARADHNLYPLYGLKPADVRDTLARIHSVDPDEWGREWIATGNRYFDQAQAEEAANPKAACEDYLAAYHYYAFGRWPVPSSPAKKEAYAKALVAFAAYAQRAEPRIEIVRVPFEGKEVVGYLIKPQGTAKAPVLVSISGVDFWKEDLALSSVPLVRQGVAVLALDMPGTGEAPLKVERGAERMYSAMIDHLLTRNDVDGRRIVVSGASWGSYWAARVAFRDHSRLRGAVVHSGPVHNYFQRSWMEPSLKDKSYLFDFVPSRLYILGKSTVEEALEYLPTLSLVTEGLVSQPAPPMLLLGGVKDPQTPYSDLLLLLGSGTTPKEAWVSPNGGHMGRTKEMDDQDIFEQISFPWILRHLEVAK
jgi:pimeloyl-ACP methyl ester carboxylesterase